MMFRLLTLTALAFAGVVHAQMPLPAAGASPLTYVRFSGPTGMEATFYQGRARPKYYPAPVVVGMRPGYVYRVQLSNIPDHPGLSIYPSIEVWGSLKLQARCGAHQFPATIHLSEEDIAAVLAGTMVTKVIYLEHPDRAEPKPTRDGEILEANLSRTQDIYNEARLRGRIMLVVHFGQRAPSDAELIQANVPGTILLPGEKVIGPAAAPPCLPLVGKLGEEECLHDGGDRLNPAGFNPEGGIGGVDPEDTIAEYRDSKGRRYLVKSNRVCVCVPRFIALRKELPLATSEGVIGPEAKKQLKRGIIIAEKTPSIEAIQTKIPLRMEGRQRPSVNLNVQGPSVFQQIKALQAQILELGPIEKLGTKQIITLTDKQKAELLEGMKVVREFSEVVTLAGYEQILHTSVTARVKPGPEVVTSHLFVRDLTVCCHETPLPPDRPLVLIKCADKGCARPGDEVTFTLKYSNAGGRPLTDVAVIDSLSARLEYVPGSAEADRDTVFTVQENEVGSQLLRWEVTGTLHPGETGRIRFKVKVR